MKKQSKLLIGIAVAIAVLIVVIAIIVLTVAGSGEDTYDSHMELAQRYLDELQYEQAIAEYELALAIEPNNVEAYLALAEVYVRIEDYEAAINVLNEGIERTGAEELAEYLENVQGQSPVIQGTEETQDVAELEKTAGEPWEETEYLDDGSYVVNEYDANGNRVKSTVYNPDGSINSWNIYEYDANGHVVKSTVYNPDGSINSWNIYEYDANGYMVKFTVYNPDGSINSWYINEYDANGHEVKFTWYNPDGSIGGWYINEYDTNENMVKSTGYGPDGSVWYIDEYDANGHIVKSTYYNADGTVEVFDY